MINLTLQKLAALGSHTTKSAQIKLTELTHYHLALFHMTSMFGALTCISDLITLI